jgi:hypothetical protein
MKKRLFLAIFLSNLVLPGVALGFSLEGSTFGGVIGYIIDILNLLIPVLVIFALLTFFWGLSKFILNSGSKDGIEKGKSYMLWGILALFILFTFRTIVGLITSDLEFGNATNIPVLKTDQSQ